MTTSNQTTVQRLLSLEPAVIRGIIVAVTGAVALVVGHEIDLAWLDTVLTVYAAVSPIIAGLFIRGAVVPAGKVISYLPDPTDQTSITSGSAVYTSETEQDGHILQESAKTINYGRHAA